MAAVLLAGREVARSLALGGPVRLRLGFHLGEPGVVVRELVEVARAIFAVMMTSSRVQFVSGRQAMPDPDVYFDPQRPEAERGSIPVDADPLTRGAGLLEGEACVRTHALDDKCPP